MALDWITTITLSGSLFAALFGYLNWTHSTSEGFREVERYVTNKYTGYKVYTPPDELEIEIKRVETISSTDRLDTIKQYLVPKWSPVGLVRMTLEMTQPVDNVITFQRGETYVSRHDLGLQEMDEVTIMPGDKDYRAFLPVEPPNPNTIIVNLPFSSSDGIHSVFQEFMTDLRMNLVKKKEGKSIFSHLRQSVTDPFGVEDTANSSTDG